MAIRKLRLALKNNQTFQASNRDGGALLNNSGAALSQLGTTDAAQILYEENTLPHEHGIRSANLITTTLNYDIENTLLPDDILHAELVIDINKNVGSVLMELTSSGESSMYMRPSNITGGLPLVKFLTYNHSPSLFLHKRNTLFQTRTLFLTVGDDVPDVPTTGDTYNGNGVFEFDFINESLVYTELINIDMEVVKPYGMTSSGNYLIIFNGSTIYWSNPLSFSDFTPAVGGAGSTKVAEARGEILTIIPTYNGLMIYCTENIISMTFSGDTSNPWIFREVPNSTGLSLGDSSFHVVPLVAVNEQQQVQYAMLNSGLHAVVESGAKKLPESINEYISSPYVTTKEAGKSEIVHTEANNIQFPYSKLQSIHSFGSYLFLRLGDIVPNSMNRMLVWDTATQSFSNIKGNWRTMHRTVTLNSLSAEEIITDKPRVVANSYVLISNEGTSENKSFYLNLATRSEAASDYDDAEVLVGNIQLDEDRTTILHSVSFNFNDEFADVRVLAFDVETQLVDEGIEFVYNPADRRYYGYIEGKNIKLLLKGKNFFLSALELEVESGGIY